MQPGWFDPLHAQYAQAISRLARGYEAAPEAQRDLERALHLATNDAERQLLQQRLTRLSP